MKKQSKSTKEWIKSFVQEEIKSGTPKKKAILIAKQIVDNLALLSKRGAIS